MCKYFLLQFHEAAAGDELDGFFAPFVKWSDSDFNAEYVSSD